MHDARPGGDTTLFSGDVVKLIKIQLNRIWQRVRVSRGLTQSQLASALGTSQSAVSKLLKVDDTHPWTTGYIVSFCDFCQVDLRSELLDYLPPEIAPAFGELSKAVPKLSGSLFEECERAIIRYANERGKNPHRDAVAKIAKKVVDRTPHQPGREDILRAIEEVLLVVALELE